MRARAHISYLVGYEACYIYRIWAPALRRVIITSNVTFDEELFYTPEDAALALPVREAEEIALEIQEGELVDVEPLATLLGIGDDKIPAEPYAGSPAPEPADAASGVEEQLRSELQSPETSDPVAQEESAPEDGRDATPAPEPVALEGGWATRLSLEDPDKPVELVDEQGSGPSHKATEDASPDQHNDADNASDASARIPSPESPIEASGDTIVVRTDTPEPQEVVFDAPELPSASTEPAAPATGSSATRASRRLRKQLPENLGLYATFIRTNEQLDGSSDERGWSSFFTTFLPDHQGARDEDGSAYKTLHAMTSATVEKHKAQRENAFQNRPDRRMQMDELRVRAPESWRELETHPAKRYFTAAAMIELRDLVAKGTWREIDRSSARGRLLPLKWVFTYGSRSRRSKRRLGLSCMYTAVMLRPDVAFVASLFSQFLTNPSEEHQVFRWD